MTDSPRNEFWDFSLAFYGDSAVQEACLDIQDNHGADVNLMLFCLYQASVGHCLADDTVRHLDAQVAAWRGEVVQPLRAIRRHLKPLPFPLSEDAQTDVRNDIKRLELRAEMHQQLHLDALDVGVAAWKPLGEAARINLGVYAGFIGADPDASSLAVLLDRFDQLYGARSADGSD